MSSRNLGLDNGSGNCGVLGSVHCRCVVALLQLCMNHAWHSFMVLFIELITNFLSAFTRFLRSGIYFGNQLVVIYSEYSLVISYCYTTNHLSRVGCFVAHAHRFVNGVLIINEFVSFLYRLLLSCWQRVGNRCNLPCGVCSCHYIFALFLDLFACLPV